MCPGMRIHPILTIPNSEANRFTVAILPGHVTHRCCESRLAVLEERWWHRGQKKLVSCIQDRELRLAFLSLASMFLPAQK